ncbi:MAG: NUDIX domain-containing protein [Planctomycetota bacterium]
MAEPLHPNADTTSRPRQAARVIALDRDERVLLFRFVDPVSGEPFWITPGGGLDDGETFEAAARRELLEETGLTPGAGLAGALGPCVWTRTVDIRYGHRRFRQHERFFPLRIRVSRPAIDTTRMTDYETTDLREHRWWSAAEVAASDERFAPSRLAALVPELRSRAAGGEPIDVGR